MMDSRLVGARGFEPPTSQSRTERSTKLSHAPPTSKIITHFPSHVQLIYNAFNSVIPHRVLYDIMTYLHLSFLFSLTRMSTAGIIVVSIILRSRSGRYSNYGFDTRV